MVHTHAGFFDLVPRLVDVGSAELATYEVGEGPLVVLLHGFPELAYSWRHQLPAVAAAGYRTVACDLRGYGASSHPTAVEDYALDRLVGDVVGLIAALGRDRAVVVGHDWGSVVAWSTAVMAPDRVQAVASLNVPYRGWCCGFPTTDYIRAHLQGRFDYVLAFQEPGVVEKQFAADPDAWLRAMHARGGGDLGFMTDEVRAVYRRAFETHGFSGPLNYYRNVDRNAAMTAHLADAPVERPALMLAAGADPILPATLAEGMERWIPELTVRIVEGAGHWVQQERPDDVNRHLIAFLDGLAREEDRWS